jgi:hypothetical protein
MTMEPIEVPDVQTENKKTYSSASSLITSQGEKQVVNLDPCPYVSGTHLHLKED